MNANWFFQHNDINRQLQRWNAWNFIAETGNPAKLEIPTRALKGYKSNPHQIGSGGREPLRVNLRDAREYFPLICGVCGLFLGSAEKIPLTIWRALGIKVFITSSLQIWLSRVGNGNISEDGKMVINIKLTFLITNLKLSRFLWTLKC